MASDRGQVEALLPHRDPFLFVDRIEARGEGSIRTGWDVDPGLECFRGHYPAHPVLPGVLICEFCFQSGALLLYASEQEFRSHSGIPVLARIQDARFKRIVRPGEALTADVRLEKSMAMARFLSAKVLSRNALVARVRFVLAMATKDAGEPA